jgi:hypothetical protein
VKTRLTQHNLCGSIKFTILFDNAVNDESVMTFDETNLEFTAESTDGSLIDQVISYTVIVELEDYPEIDPDQAFGTIEFTNPCKELTTFTAT